MEDLNEEVFVWALDSRDVRYLMSQTVHVVTRIDGSSAGFLRYFLADEVGDMPCQEASAQAALFLRRADHGSPLWRLLVCIASGKVTREDLRILADVVEALADG